MSEQRQDDGPSSAFVTGGSGFVGGALIRRLVEEGWRVRALARSQGSADKVAALGAEPATGDLEDAGAMTRAAEGCEVAFHAAVHLGEWGPRAEFERINVGGTRNVISACRGAGVRRLVHVGTEAALMAGEPLVDVDEDAPLRPDSPVPYCSTKALAEQAVRDAADGGLETVVVRPRLIWGPGDTTILPSLVEAVRSGRFRWIGGGRHRTSTTHVANVVEGLLLGAQRGASGAAYFVTDGEPVVFRDFVKSLVGTQGVEVPDKELPAGIARAAAAAAEGLWKGLRLSGAPPITRIALWLSSQECTIDISRARAQLGYQPRVTVAGGIEELAAAA
ncbi:MAG TPA: NAD-dependent epimerase/dehydratase family protein [Solirubrobacteraceae bacterium]|nr:NAD-dependent epimerase/dehydratase family protein [Solirubrobacteraceae bacterium]